mgnify:CR=1 FL=1
MLLLTLQRYPFRPDSTMGELSVNGAAECFTMERPWLDNAPEVSCIPAGSYEVVKTFSGHFKRMMPLLVDVPNRSEIRIHPANWVTQLEGCIAVGVQHGADFLEQSVAAFDPLYAKMDAAWEAGEAVRITIMDAPVQQILTAA